VPKSPAKKTVSSTDNLKDLNQELSSASGKLLETSGVMHTFAQSLQTSGFREYVDYIGRPWRSFWVNFLIGIARGLGFVIGATVVVALVVWIISQILSQLPFVGEFFQTLGDFLSTENLEKIQSSNFIDSVDELFNSFKANVIETQSAIPPAQ
jgi:hypothetical protein